MIDKATIDVLNDSHQQWLNHPVTQMFIKCLEKQKENLKNAIISQATNNNITDASLRYNAVSLRNSEAITIIVHNFEKMKQLLEIKEIN